MGVLATRGWKAQRGFADSGPFVWFAQQMHSVHELYSIPHWQMVAGSILAGRLLNLPLFFNAVRALLNHAHDERSLPIDFTEAVHTGWLWCSHAPYSAAAG